MSFTCLLVLLCHFHLISFVVQVFGMGSYYFPKARMSVGAWAISSVISAPHWHTRDDLLADVAEVGDTVYARPLVHTMQHNAIPLARVRAFLGLPADKVTIMHHEAQLPVGEFVTSFGGRTKHNVALAVAASALKEEGFSRVGLGVYVKETARTNGMFVQVILCGDVGLRFPSAIDFMFGCVFWFHLKLLFTSPQGFRGVTDERMDLCWLVNRLQESHFDLMRSTIINKIGAEISGNTRKGSVYDPTNRF
jgi:peptidyl-tRNA hydrolase